MANLFLKDHGGYCDFCGSHPPNRMFGRTDMGGSTDRDICKACVTKFYGMFGGSVIQENNNFLTMLGALAKRLLDGPTKKFIKAGFMNNDLTLTPEGEAEVLAIILESQKVELEKSADAKIAEMKDEK